ncbi:unnamed protein product, partial [Amoebophrya sp. A25]
KSGGPLLTAEPRASDFEYLRHGCTTAPKGISDESGWKETEESFLNLWLKGWGRDEINLAVFSSFLALTLIGFSSTRVSQIAAIVLAILTLGNVSFKSDATGEGSEVANEECLKQSAELLGLDSEVARFAECLTQKKLYVGKEVTPVLLTTEKAHAAKDAIAKLFYLHLFKEIILIMNETLLVADSQKTKVSTDNYIGILDIAGFESFAVNSLEQLFINLSNECLQQYFNDYVFKSELSDYKSEAVPITDIKFSDNLDILELIQGRQGLLDYLDEELNVNKATYETYGAKVNKNFAEHARFVKNRFSEPKFAIRHFA